MSEIKYNKKRLKKVESILISQPKPSNDASPFYKLVNNYNLKVDFRPFEQLDPVSVKDFRKQKINILEHTAIIFTSRNAVDHFFKLAEGLKINIPTDMKYFCISEQTANYLQKYIVIRKRKIFVGNRTPLELLDAISEAVKKFPDEKFLFPCSDVLKIQTHTSLEESGLQYTKAKMYKVVCSDLSDLADVKYDILVFFSPTGIKSLFENFPNFDQGDTRLAIFGSTTLQSVKERGLRIDIEAPNKKAPSMSMALDQYIKEANKRKR